MGFLIDTNIFLEIILNQEQSETAKELLTKQGNKEFFISDYSLHSIGLLLFRRKHLDAFQFFVDDMILRGGIVMLSLVPQDMESVINSARKFDLDFDDSYQYATADKYGLTIVSFDKDFDRTEMGRKAPEEVLA